MTKPDFQYFAAQIAAILKTSPSLITRDTTANDVDGWDSVRHAIIILTLEDLYGVQFADDEVADLPNVGMLFDMLVERSGD